MHGSRATVSLFSSVLLPMIALLLTTLPGCSGAGEDGPFRYGLSGTVTLDGQPVPTGMILFTPDSSRGNTGPATMVEIQDGQYQTTTGKGVVGGPMIIEITGSDGIPVDLNGETIPSGTVIVQSYRIEKDLSTESSNVNFDIPKDQAMLSN